METISKEKIKLINHLRDKKYREKLRKYVVEGEKIAKEYLNYANKDIYTICATDEFFNKIDYQLIKSIPYKYSISPEMMKRISDLSTPTSVLLVINYKEKIFNLNNILKSSDIIIVLENIQDPGNLGTIIRTADWFGVNNIICSTNSVDCYNQKVIQASMGSLLRVNIWYQDLQKFLLEIKQNENIKIYGTFLEGENIYKDDSLKLPAVIIFGNESKGISNNLTKLINKKLYIPSFSTNTSKANSLNVAISASIIISEFRRRFL